MDAGLLFISGCTAYDVVINPTFYNKIQNSELFKSFFLTIIFEGLESKYDLELERNWTVLKNKKCMGVLQPHFIRSKSKPVIMEMDDENTSTTKEGKTASVSFFSDNFLSPALQMLYTTDCLHVNPYQKITFREIDSGAKKGLGHLMEAI